MSLDQKGQVFDQYLLQVLLYGSETWAINCITVSEMQVAQCGIE